MPSGRSYRFFNKTMSLLQLDGGQSGPPAGFVLDLFGANGNVQEAAADCRRRGLRSV
jgi:hypothetical protein